MSQDPSPEQAPLVEAVRAEFDRTAAIVFPKLADRPEPEFRNREIANMQVAQNVLRTCMEAVLQKLIPYSHTTCGDLAIRLASYAMSAAPMEDQEMILAMVLDALPAAHRKRMASGIRISTSWQMRTGDEQPNFPDDPDAE